MIFLPIYVQFNGQTFSGLSEKKTVLSFNPRFFGLKCKNMTFFKKNGFELSFLSNLSVVGNKLVLST